MNTVWQDDLVKLLTAANKLLPTKAALHKTIWLKRESRFIPGYGRETTTTISPYFAGITLEATADGFLSATVHLFEEGWVAYASVPQRIKALVPEPFRVTVYADVVLPLVRLLEKKQRVGLQMVEGNLVIVQGRNTSTFKAIAQHTFYDHLYAEATTPAPVVIQWIVPPAPLMLPAPKIAGLLCAPRICGGNYAAYYQ